MKNFLAFTIIMGLSLAAFAQKADSTKTHKIIFRGSPVAGTEPLVVIDGNKQFVRGTSTLDAINQKDIESISVLKDSMAINKYGAEGFAGVIEVKTKNNPLASPNPVSIPKQGYKAPLKGKAIGFTVRPQTSPANNSNFSINKTGINVKSTKDKPLYIVDGKEVTGIANVEQKDIESVTVLKDASDVSAYGDKGKNGVIIVTTKKARTAPKKN